MSLLLSPGCCCEVLTYPCSPCPIPLGTLHATLVFESGPDQEIDLPMVAENGWSSDTVTVLGTDTQLSVSCNDGQIEWVIYDVPFLNLVCGSSDSPGVGSPPYVTLDVMDCDPFHAEWTMPEAPPDEGNPGCRGWAYSGLRRVIFDG